ncbi:MAG: HAD-IC family P-type ATPase [Clostridia bacterium]
MDYKQSARDIAAELGSDTDRGLTIEKAHERIHSRGRNTIRIPRVKRTVSGVWRHVLSPMNVVLMLMAVMHLVAEGGRGILLSVCLVLCAFVNSAVGYINFTGDNSPSSAVNAAQNENVRVIRSGAEKIVNAALLAQGDIILLEKGQTVPADAKIIECSSLVVDESILNGDSSSVAKSAQSGMDSENVTVLYMGTKILSGSARAIVTAVGDRTQLGATIGMLENNTRPLSSMARKNEKIGNIFGAAAALVWVAALVLRLVNGYGVVSAFDNSISAALAAVPAALPFLLLVTMSMDVFRLRKQGIEARSVSAVESLGATTLLCVGKRGTLTEAGFAVGQIKSARGFDENGLRLLAAMCTTADMSGDRPIGDAMQVALIEDAVAHGYSAADIRKKMPLERVLDDRSRRRLMTTVHKTETGYTVICKGAPDAVAACCSYIYDNGARLFDAAKDLPEIIGDSIRMSADALSVIAVAYKDVNSLDGPIESGLIFAGLVGLSNSVRKDTVSAVKSLKSMGVRTCLITNENLTTASAVAAKCGISREVTAQGGTLDFGDIRRLRKTTVFADIGPKQKAAIVSALNSEGENPAVVGRSVRDIGAMNSGEVSIVTEAGAKVCSAAADIKVVGSGLGCIARAVRECKRSFVNTERMTGFLISCNIAQTLCAVISLAMGYSTPFTPLGIMWMNVCVAAVAAVGIWLEPYHKTKNLNKRNSLNKTNAVSSGTVLRGLAMGAAAMLVYAAAVGSAGIVQRRTMVFLTLCAGFSFMAQSCRSSLPVAGIAAANPGAIVCLALNIAVIFFTIDSPVMQNAFGIERLQPGAAAVCVIVGLVPALAAELFKIIKIKTSKNGRV